MISTKTSGTRAALLAASLAGEGSRPKATARRTIETLLCVAAAVVAFSAVAVAQASAASFHFESSPTWLWGVQETQNVFTFSGGTIKCSVAEYRSSAAVSSTSAAPVEVHPTYGNCSAFGQGLTFSTTGCSFVLSAVTSLAGSLVIACSTTGMSMHGSTTGCSVLIGPQTAISPAVAYTSSSTGIKGVKTTFGVSGFTYTSTGGACGASGSNGSLSGTVAIKGFASATFSEQHGFNTE